MAIDLFNLGKQAVRKLLPTKVNNVISRLGDFGIDLGLSTNLDVKDPQRAYMWEVKFRDSSGSGEHVTHYAKNTAIPTSMSENIKRWHAGVEYSYPGRDVSPRIFRVTFWDNQNLDSYRYFQYWFDIMNQGVERRKVNPINYLRSVELVMKDSSDVQELFTFKFDDVYPTEVGEVTLSYAESAEYTFDIMFTYRHKSIS